MPEAYIYLNDDWKLHLLDTFSPDATEPKMSARLESQSPPNRTIRLPTQDFIGIQSFRQLLMVEHGKYASWVDVSDRHPISIEAARWYDRLQWRIHYYEPSPRDRLEIRIKALRLELTLEVDIASVREFDQVLDMEVALAYGRTAEATSTGA